jgi:hypothetical protein
VADGQAGKKHERAATLAKEEPTMSDPKRIGAGDITDAALVSAAQAVNSLADPCDWGNSQAAVKAFQSQYNASTGGTLAVDGYYGTDTAAANAAVAAANGGGNVQSACTAYTNTPAPAPTPTPTPGPTPAPITPAPSGMNPVLKWGLILILVAGAGAGLWWLFFSKKGPMKKKRHGAHERKKRKKSRR